MTALLTVRAVADLGSLPRASGPGWTLVGQDGGQSIELGAAYRDHVLMVFADTLLAELPSVAPPPLGRSAKGCSAQGHRRRGRFLGNCAALVPRLSSGSVPAIEHSLTALDYYTDAEGWPREIFETTGLERACGVRLWPQHGLWVDGRVVLFYLAIQHLGKNSWSFSEAGSGLALFDPGTGRAERVRREDGEWCFWPSVEDGLQVGVQVLKSHDGWVYLYASLRRDDQCVAHVARTRADTMHQPQTYTYYAGTGPSWTTDSVASPDLGPCGNELSVSWNEHLGRYLMIFLYGLEKRLCLRTAPDPWGPWSEVLDLGEVPHAARSPVVSLAFEHPTWARDGGRTIYITYCQPHFEQNHLLAITFR